jgi:hypothetical protein
LSAVIGLALFFGIPDSIISLPPDPIPFILIVLKYIGVINIGLAIFNLIPAFPMDGGRILRSALAIKKGRLKATFIASRLGRVLAILMGLYALLGSDDIQYILLLIAGFVFMSAGSEYKYVLMQEEAKKNKNNENPFGNLFNQFKEINNFEPPTEEDSSEVVEITPPPYEKSKKNKKASIFKDK